MHRSALQLDGKSSGALAKHRRYQRDFNGKEGRPLYLMQSSGPRKCYARREHLVPAELETRLRDTPESVDLVHQTWELPDPVLRRSQW